MDHEAAKTTKCAKHEGFSPRRAPSRSSCFVNFAALRVSVVQILSRRTRDLLLPRLVAGAVEYAIAVPH